MRYVIAKDPTRLHRWVGRINGSTFMRKGEKRLYVEFTGTTRARLISRMAFALDVK